MKAIKKRRNRYAMLSVAFILLTVLFSVTRKTAAATFCGALSTAALILLYRQSRLLGAAMVICDSRILTVPPSAVTAANGPNPKQAEDIVSTFGLLLGSRVYPWGCEGVYGVRLREVQIDSERICLSFGKKGDMLRVELLHGLTDDQSARKIAQKIWQETGVRAVVNGWEPKRGNFMNSKGD